MAFNPPSIRSIAAEMADSLSAGSDSEALRLAFQFVERYDRAPTHERAGMVEAEPKTTGDLRYDALIAAIAEYCCARDLRLPPSWVEGPNRFLERWWFVSGMRTLHADAIAHSPISFARRGVFITEDALTYA